MYECYAKSHTNYLCLESLSFSKRDGVEPRGGPVTWKRRGQGLKFIATKKIDDKNFRRDHDNLDR